MRKRCKKDRTIETRVCALDGCKNTFECEVSSSRKYCCSGFGHSRKGKTNGPKWLAAIKAANTGDGNAAKRPEVRAKMKESAEGRIVSIETRQAMSEGHLNSEVFHQAMKTRKPPRLGTTTSPEAIENMKRANQGRTCSEEHKKRTSETMLEFYSNLENRIKKAKEIAGRIAQKGYQFKTGYITLPRLGMTLLYRSSYELTALLMLDSRQEVVEVLGEVNHIPYCAIDSRIRIYIPDMLITLDDGQKFLIEVKPEKKVNDEFKCKIPATLDWCKKNQVTYCIWTEKVLYNNSSTTTPLRVILEATAVDPLGQRYSLNRVVTHGKEQK